MMVVGAAKKMKVGSVHRKKLGRCAALLVIVLLASCGGSKDKIASQSLAQVNDSDITVLQLNEEFVRSKVPEEQKEVATKQLLEALIDRQLLQSEALRDKVDRDPQVVQAIERAKSQILTQAYLQKRLINLAKPSKAEIEAYFDAHPEVFAQSKIYAMRELILATTDITAELTAVFSKASSLEEVAAWLRAHKIQFAGNQLANSAADLPADLLKKLQGMKKGQLFAAKEGDRSILVELHDIKDSPVSLEAATPQIGQYLLNEKNKIAAEAEVARLRANAKIVYLNQAEKTGAADKAAVPATELAPAVAAVSPVAAANPLANASAPSSAASATEASPPAVTDEQIKRGVAGLR